MSVKTEQTKSDQKPRPPGVDALIALTACGLLALSIFVALRFMPRRNIEVSDEARNSRLTNLAALPPEYNVAANADMSNARSVWVEHKGASDNAHVLVSIIQASDPTGMMLNRYYALHLHENCRFAKDQQLRSQNRVIRVARSICLVDGGTLIEEQAVFPLSDFYAVVIDETAERTQFDYPAFAAVLNTVAQAKPPHRTPGS